METDQPIENCVVVIPAYNEGRFIGSVVLQARRRVRSVLVVDDGSTDDTARIASDAGALVIRHNVNRGKAAALNSGFMRARQMEGIEVVVVMDADGQHFAEEIEDVVMPILEKRADIVVGSRFLGRKSEIPRWRVFGQHALTMATNLGAGSFLTDSQNGFRAFSQEVLGSLQFDSEGFSVESEMQFLIRQGNLKVIEVPTSVVYEEPSKRNPFLHGMQVLNGIFHLISIYRPLLFFGGGGLIGIGLGVSWGLYVVDIYIRKQELAVGYALISVLLTIVGSSAVLTGIMLHFVSGLMRDIKKAIGRLNS